MCTPLPAAVGVARNEAGMKAKLPGAVADRLPASAPPLRAVRGSAGMEEDLELVRAILGLELLQPDAGFRECLHHMGGKPRY